MQSRTTPQQPMQCAPLGSVAPVTLGTWTHTILDKPPCFTTHIRMLSSGFNPVQALKSLSMFFSLKTVNAKDLQTLLKAARPAGSLMLRAGSKVPGRERTSFSPLSKQMTCTGVGVIPLRDLFHALERTRNPWLCCDSHLYVILSA